MPQKLALRARTMIWLGFGTMGIMSNAWVPRIPEIKHALGLSNSQFGFALVGSPIGLLIGTQLSGRIIHRWGSRRIALFSGMELAIAIIFLGMATTRSGLMFALFLLGFGYSIIDNAMNTQSVAVEKILDRRYMSGFHGAWSVGALLAASAGGLLTHVTSARINIVSAGVGSFVAIIPIMLGLLPDELDGHLGEEGTSAAKIPLFGKGTGILWLIGFGLIGCLIPEAGTTDWAGILLHEHMGVASGLDSSAFIVFALAMIAGRFSGDHLMTKYGAERVVKIGGYVGGSFLAVAIGLGVWLSSWNLVVALIIINLGFAVAGFGIAPMVPAFISATGKISGIAPSVALARIGLIGLMAYYVGPVVVGTVADWINLPVAMGFPCIVLIGAGYLSRTVRAQAQPV